MNKQIAVNDLDYEYGYDYIAEGTRPVKYRKASKNYIRKAVMNKNDEHKELVYFLGIQHLSPKEMAELRGQSDRNIRKVRDTALRKVQRQIYKDLTEMIEKGYDATLRKRQFIRRYENGMEDSP